MALVSSGITLGSEVGLQLLLAPKTSTNILRAACTVVGIGVPVFSSFKAVEKNERDEKDGWLVYWSVYGCVSVIETFADKILAWCPYYYHAKLVALIWMQIPNNVGARYLYDRTLRPVLLKHYDRIDWAVESGRRQIVRFMQTNQQELAYVGRLLRAGVAAGCQAVKDTLRAVLLASDEKAPPPSSSSTTSDQPPAPASTLPSQAQANPGPSAPPPVTAAPSAPASSTSDVDPTSPRGWVQVPPPGSLDDSEEFSGDGNKSARDLSNRRR